MHSMHSMHQQTDGFGHIFVIHSFIEQFNNYVFALLGGVSHSQHMEVARLGVKSELQRPAYTTATATQDQSCIYNLRHRSRQCWIFNPLSKAKDQTCILMDASQIRFR